jgi:hypothetical protein
MFTYFLSTNSKTSLHENQCGKGFSSSTLLMIWTMNLNFRGQLEKKMFVNPKYPLKMAQKPMNQMYQVSSMYNNVI